MSRTGPLPFELSDPWTYALVGGLASIPFTVAGYAETASELSLTPVLFGGILAGYLAKRRTGTRAGVGARAGLVGGLPGLWMLSDLLAATSALAGPPWFMVAGGLLALSAAVGIALLVLGLSALSGAVGARVGGWLAGSGGRRRPAAPDS